MSLIQVTLGGETKWDENHLPYVEGGYQTFMEADELEKRVITIDTDDYITTATEYWEGKELRHRSCHAHMKKWPKIVEPAEVQQGMFVT